MDIGTRIGRHRQHRQWGGVRSTIGVPMLPMAAYVVAYVTLLPKMRGAYVPMCFFWVLARGGRGHGQIGQIGQPGQNDAKSAKCVQLFCPPRPAHGYAACALNSGGFRCCFANFLNFHQNSVACENGRSNSVQALRLRWRRRRPARRQGTPIAPLASAS